MALLRAHLPPLVRRHAPCLSALSTTTSANRTGFLEQVRRTLLPEIPLPPNTSATDSTKLLVREPTVVLREQVIEPYTADSESTGAPSLVILDGVRGAGKSALAQQTTAFARLRGYLVLYIPEARTWSRGGGFFSATALEGRDPVLEGVDAVRFYDRPFQLQAAFKTFLEAHREQLAEIACKRELDTELTEGCESLLELVEMGAKFVDEVDSNWRKYPASAGEVFGRLVRELCACEDRPVAIVIDDYEQLVGLTCMVNESKQCLHANCIRTVADHFGRDAIEDTAKDIANGFVMLVTDPGHAFQDWRKSRVRSGADYPLSKEVLNDPSGREWMQAFKARARKSDNQMVLDAPEFTNSELKATCSTFVQGGLRKLIPREQEEDAARLVALAGGRGDVMKRIVLTR